MINGNFLAGGSEKINVAELMEVLANHSIQAGDTVYVNGFPVSDIKADVGGTALSSTVYTAAFSPDNRLLVIGGSFSGYVKLYSVSGNAITYLSDIYADGIGIELSHYVHSAAFSPDGSKLVLGGYKYVKLYSVSGNAITYLSDIYADGIGTEFSHYVYSTVFSPDGNRLVIGGRFSGKAKLYSVNGNSVTYLSDIKSNASTSTLSGTVRTASFSPDNTRLVLGGEFSGKAKLYSVNGNTVTYLSDIKADAVTTALSYHVYTAAFSPDGSLLVLGGEFAGRAKMYSVSGNAVLYLSDIKSDASGTELSNITNTAAFSPDGSLLMLGGSFNRFAKLFYINGTSVTYASDIHTWLTNPLYIAAFSTDGSKLVIGGGFTGAGGSGYAKLYSVSGNAILYAAEAYCAPDGIIQTNLNQYGVGYAKGNIPVGGTGKVKLIGTVKKQ